MNARAHAQDVTVAFEARLHNGGRVDTFEYEGTYYVITSGTGEGYDFAYDADDLAPGTFEDPAWDYSTWCASGPQPVTDLGLAVAYYMREGRLLGEGGSCTPVLSKEQQALLTIARNAV